METEFKFKKNAKVWTDDFWYDLTDGGYIKPDEFIADKAQAKAVNDAIELLKSMQRQMENKNILKYR